MSDQRLTGRLDETDLAHFQAFGWTRILGAFGTDEAAAMCAAVWDELANMGIERTDRMTWTVERPPHLQKLRRNPVFSAIGSPAVLAMIEALLGDQAYGAPRDWGSLFIAFPTSTAWLVPASGWHVDASYLSPLWPPRGVKTFALLADVEHRAGGTLMISGSHRLISDWFAR